MPWWSWILIWGGLTLALFGMLAFLGWRLFRKVLTAMDEFGRLAEKAEMLGAMADELGEPARTPAMLRSRSEVLAEHRRTVKARESRGHTRRENRAAQGRLLISADYRAIASRIKGA